MKKRNRLALLLAAAVTLSTLGVSAANNTGEEPEIPLLIAPAPTASQPAASAPEQTGQAEEELPAQEQEPAAPVEDAEGTLSFANLEGKVRSGSLDYLYLEEMIAQVESIDYDKLKEDLRDGLNAIADAQWAVQTSGSAISTGMPTLDAALQGIMGMSTTYTKQTLDTQYKTLRQQFDDLKEGKIQKDAADGVRQMRHAQNNIVMLAQAAYVQLSEAQAGSATLERALNALDRQIQELELRYDMGQISTMTLQQAKAGRTTLVSTRQTLENSVRTGLMNLENLMGVPLTGQMQLTGVPAVTAEQLAEMDLERDMATAKQASYTLYAAQKTLDDARETYEQAEDDYGPKDYQLTQAKHAWQAAQYSHQGAERSFELSFTTLYNQVKDYAQVLQASRTGLAVKQDSYAAAQLKYSQGTISYNAMLTARDDVSAAQDEVNTAARNLFSAYNNYRWAVDHGILN